MRKGLCPKCNSTEIYHGVQSPLHAGDGLVHAEASDDKRHANLMLDAYVCNNCGYVELYVAPDNMEQLSVVRHDKNWIKVV